jgi:hypothetical protein
VAFIRSLVSPGDILRGPKRSADPGAAKRRPRSLHCKRKDQHSHLCTQCFEAMVFKITNHSRPPPITRQFQPITLGRLVPASVSRVAMSWKSPLISSLSAAHLRTFNDKHCQTWHTIAHSPARAVTNTHHLHPSPIT